MSKSHWDIPANKFNFKKDLAFGQQGEKLVEKFLGSLNETAFEIKTDRYRNGRMAVEVMQNPKRAGKWKKSGLAITKAHWWVYVYTLNEDHGAFVVVSVPRLRRYIDIHKDDMWLMDFAKKSDNPARGYLLEPEQVMEMMISPDYDGV